MEQYKISIEDIKYIEGKAYPRHMMQMDDCADLADLADYAECSTKNLRVFGEPGHWYLVIAKHNKICEIIDVAKIPGSKSPPWGEILDWMKRTSRIWTADLREKTSLKIFERFNYLFHIKKRRVWRWDNEIMVKITFALANA